MNLGRVGRAALALVWMGVLACGGPEEAPPEAAVSRRAQRQAALGLGAPTLVANLETHEDYRFSLGDQARGAVRAGGRVFFSLKVRDALGGAELWATDGSAEGTRLVRDLSPLGDSAPGQLTALGDAVYFSAHDGARSQVWRSDGTARGTVPLTQGPSLEDPRLAATADTLFFSGRETSGEPGLWKSDGTVAGTTRLRTLDAVAEPLEAVGGTLYFAVRHELWKSDGTAAGTTRVKALASASTLSSPVPLGGTLFFLVTDAQGTRALWKSDGTDAGSVPVEGLMEGRVLASPAELTALGPTLYFSAEDAQGGRELWKSDGTGAGTVRVKDIVPGSGGSAPSGLCPLGGVLYFLAQEEASGRELWKSDGTAEGTVRLTDLVLGPADSFSGDVFASERQLFLFSPTAGGAFSLWTTDGVKSPQQVGLYWERAPQTDRVPRSERARVKDVLVFIVDSSRRDSFVWTSDGTPTGTHLLRDGRLAEQGSEAVALGEAAGRMLFSVHVPPSHERFEHDALWATDGTRGGTRQLLDTLEETPRLARQVNGLVYLSLFTPEAGRELWRTDGTPGGTWLTRDLAPGSASSNPLEGTALGGQLLFVATTAAQGRELWRTDGTPEGTVLLKDVRPGAFSSEPRGLVRVGALVYFVANDGVHGAELWRTDGTPEGTWLVMDRVPGSVGFSPYALTDFNGTLVLKGRDVAAPGQPDVLWRLEGPETLRRVSSHVLRGGEWLRASGPTLFYSRYPEPASEPLEIWAYGGGAEAPVRVFSGAFTRMGEPVAAGGGLFFRGSEPEHGAELWRVDAPPGGVRRVTDTLPGYMDGVLGEPVAIEGTHQVMFSATDGVHGAEPWISDGTEAGTLRVGNVAPGAEPSSPRGFLRGAKGVFFSAYSLEEGRELWLLPLPPDGDAPPQVTCPADKTVEMDVRSGARVSWPVPAASDDSGLPLEVLSQPESGSYFPLGHASVRVRAMDPAGQTAECSFAVNVVDTQPPVLTCPADLVVEATSSTGAYARFTPVSATDLNSFRLEAPLPSTKEYPLGETVETARATDAAGNTATCSFRITVRDTRPPELTCPRSVTQEATSRLGREVTYGAASVHDGVTRAPGVTYSQASGTRFALGTTPVTVTATDAVGNSASCVFTVTVTDSVPPVVKCPDSLFREATSAEGAWVTYGPALASDELSAVSLSYSQASGTRFALGSTPVKVTATDAWGNSASCVFGVYVNDSVAPVLTCPADQVVEATEARGAWVHFAASASDAVTDPPVLTYSQAPDTRFGLGETQVRVTARDAAGQTSTCSFLVRVRDTTPPQLTCPASVTVEATSTSGAVVSYGAAVASDAVSAVSVVYTQASGTRFPLGTTSVRVGARDVAGNQSTCAFDVRVRDTTAPTLTCPADQVLTATRPEGAEAVFSVSARDLASARLVPTLSHVSGSVFPVGRTRVSASVGDNAGNVAGCFFHIVVMDPRAAR